MGDFNAQVGQTKENDSFGQTAWQLARKEVLEAEGSLNVCYKHNFCIMNSFFNKKKSQLDVAEPG